MRVEVMRRHQQTDFNLLMPHRVCRQGFCSGLFWVKLWFFSSSVVQLHSFVETGTTAPSSPGTWIGWWANWRDWNPHQVWWEAPWKVLNASDFDSMEAFVWDQRNPGSPSLHPGGKSRSSEHHSESSHQIHHFSALQTRTEPQGGFCPLPRTCIDINEWKVFWWLFFCGEFGRVCCVCLCVCIPSAYLFRNSIPDAGGRISHFICNTSVFVIQKSNWQIRCQHEKHSCLMQCIQCFSITASYHLHCNLVQARCGRLIISCWS